MTQTEYDKAKQECLSDFCKEHGFIETADVKGIFGYAFDRAYALGKQEVKRHVSVKEACEILGVDESEATTLVKSKPIETCTDDCSSPDHFVVKDEMVDNIIKDGFKNHNRLNIAAMAMQGILSNIDLFKNVLETGMETLGGDGISFRAVAKSSFLFADALINEAEEGGSK